MGEKKQKKTARLASLGFFILPLAVFALSAVRGVNQILPLVTIILLGVLIIWRFLPKKPLWTSTGLWTLLVLMLVFSTGGFLSPFMFLLYLAAIALAFIFGPLATAAFTMSIVIIFSFGLGAQNAAYETMTLLSLLLPIPIAIVLRRNYLIVQEARKGILILEREAGKNGTSLETILGNRVNLIGVTLRQPITYLKQAVNLLISGGLSREEEKEMLPRMKEAVDGLFTLVKGFESDVTKNKFLGRGEGKTIKP